MPERALAYDPNFDTVNHYQLQISETEISLEEFTRLQDQLNSRIRRNLETNLGERFNVELSQVSYQLDQNGNLKNPDHDEPFLEIVKRGQRYRQSIGSKETEREKAEVIGFQHVQELLQTTDDRRQTTVIVISPRGSESSAYQHNFFDIYEKSLPLDEDSPCLITMTRFTSQLSYEEFWKVAKYVDPSLPQPLRPTDAYFLSHPLTTDMPHEEILGKFNPKKDTMPLGEYQKLIEACTPLIITYINALENNPNSSEIRQIYNAILNFADHISLSGSDPANEGDPRFTCTVNVQSTINQFGSLPVRQVTTGCGIQSGFSPVTSYQLPVTGFSPFSVSEFGLTIDGCSECGGSANHFHCPQDKGGCGGRIPSGQGITKCPNCSLTKEQAGSRC